MMSVVFVSLFFALAAAQGNEPCNSPPQWEALEYHVNYGGEYGKIERISYDETNLRYRRIEEIEFFNRSRDAFDQLFLHNEKIGFSLNLRTRECTKFPLNEPFQVNGVPAGGRFIGSRYIGSSAASGAGVEVKEFEANTERGLFHGVFTVEDCLPVYHSYFSEVYGYRTSRYFDITGGIRDPNVFIPPEECL
jgi:hypothetical protein